MARTYPPWRIFRLLMLPALFALGSCAQIAGETMSTFTGKPYFSHSAKLSLCQTAFNDRATGVDDETPLSQADYSRGFYYAAGVGTIPSLGVPYTVGASIRCPITTTDRIFHAAQQQRQARAVAASAAWVAARAARAAHLAAVIAGAVATAKARGYPPVTARDFKLDGRSLAVTSAHVAISGIYAHVGNVDYLFDSTIAFYLALRGHENPLTVPVILTGAPRLLRSHLLACQGAFGDATGSCPVTLEGTASTCEVTSSFSFMSRSVPCLIVDHGWWLTWKKPT